MQPGYPGSGQDPYGQQPPYSDPYAQPQYPQQPPPPQPYADPYAQPPQQPYADPYAQPPTSGSPYPSSPAYPGSPQYQVAGYGAPGLPPQQNNTFGLLAMIFGIISIPFAVCCSWVNIAISAAAIVLGVIGLKKAGEDAANNRGQALAGVICGAVGLVLTILMIILSFTLSFGDFLTNQ